MMSYYVGKFEYLWNPWSFRVSVTDNFASWRTFGKGRKFSPTGVPWGVFLTCPKGTLLMKIGYQLPSGSYQNTLMGKKISWLSKTVTSTLNLTDCWVGQIVQF